MHTPRAIVCLLAACLLAAGGARGDIIHLKTGQVEGRVIEETDDEVVVETKVGKVTLKKSQVVRIEEKASPLDIYHEMAAKVGENDAEGHFSLGRWCADHKLFRQAREEYRKTIAIDPDHKGARERLGYVHKHGKWMTRAEAKRADGFVRHEGRWVTAEERDRELRREAVLDRLQALRKVLARGPMTPGAIAERLTAILGPDLDERDKTSLRVLLRELTNEADEKRRDRTADARLALVDLVGEQEALEAAELLRRTAIVDREPQVRTRAARCLAERDSLDDTAYFVGLIRRFTADRYRINGTKKTRSLARRVLRRTAEALELLGDPRAVPMLAESMVVRFHIPEQDEGLPPMSIGFSTTSFAGPGRVFTDDQGNQFVLPVTEGTNWGLNPQEQEREAEDLFFFNEAAYNALRKITGQDFGHDKKAWLSWWYRHRHELEKW
ncbi:MAG: hypothetical protein ACLF0G_04895 [Candidatus Brocadiia bacterium]